MLKSSLLVLFSLTLLAGCYRKLVTEIKNDNAFGVSKDDFDSFLESRMKALNIPGLSIAFIEDGKVWHHKTMGYANVEKKLPVTDKTIFEGASISKSIFAFFVMTYV